MISGAPPKVVPQRDRAAVGRRREDKALAAELTALKDRIARIGEDKRQQRHAIRRQCKALLYEDRADANESRSKPGTSVLLLDLSDGGAALFTEREFMAGTRHVIEFAWEEGRVLRTPAVVSYSRYMEKREGFATGFQFVDTPATESEHLTQILGDVLKTSGV